MKPEKFMQPSKWVRDCVRVSKSPSRRQYRFRKQEEERREERARGSFMSAVPRPRPPPPPPRRAISSAQAITRNYNCIMKRSFAKGRTLLRDSNLSGKMQKGNSATLAPFTPSPVCHAKRRAADAWGKVKADLSRIYTKGCVVISLKCTHSLKREGKRERAALLF